MTALAGRLLLRELRPDEADGVPGAGVEPPTAGEVDECPLRAGFV